MPQQTSGASTYQVANMGLEKTIGKDWEFFIGQPKPWTRLCTRKGDIKNHFNGKRNN